MRAFIPIGALALMMAFAAPASAQTSGDTMPAAPGATMGTPQPDTGMAGCCDGAGCCCCQKMGTKPEAEMPAQ